MSRSPLHPDVEPHVLDGLVSKLEDIQRREHALHAERLTVLAQCDVYAQQLYEDTSLSRDIAYRSTHAEIAAALRMASVTVSNHMHTAASIVSHYPRTHALMRDGVLSQRHATIILDAGRIITQSSRRLHYESAVLEYAVRESTSRLQATARHLAESFTDQPLTERHENAKQHRHVQVQALDDGMAELRALLPAIEAYGIFDRLTRMARHVKHAEAAPLETPGSTGHTDAQAEDTRHTAANSDAHDHASQAAPSSTVRFLAAPSSENEITQTSEPTGDAAPGLHSTGACTTLPRNIHELRADVLSDLLLVGAPSPSLARKGLGAISAVIQVTIPDAHLTPQIPDGSDNSGNSDNAGNADISAISDASNASQHSETQAAGLLTGYGPIDHSTARDLASHETQWVHIHTNPVTGAFNSTTRYQPTPQLRRQLRVRDFHCRFPGCRTPATRCDLDHTIDAAHGGPTNTANLAHLCRPHHTLKHATDWNPVQHPDGILTWTSPTGRRYTDYPASRVIFKSLTAPPSDNPLRSRPPGNPPSRSQQATCSSPPVPATTRTAPPVTTTMGMAAPGTAGPRAAGPRAAASGTATPGPASSDAAASGEARSSEARSSEARSSEASSGAATPGRATSGEVGSDAARSSAAGSSAATSASAALGKSPCYLAANQSQHSEADSTPF